VRAVVQRVSSARVEVDGSAAAAIERGLLVLLGVARDDGVGEAEWMANKLVGLRIFEDREGKLNLSVQDVGGSILLVSQFTLLGDCRKGRRPSFTGAAPPEDANRLYEEVARRLREGGVSVATGVFRARMAVHLVNDGPVTLILDGPHREAS
jgi:D-tyrosyl-tRNA(Tyr) deacylase